MFGSLALPMCFLFLLVAYRPRCCAYFAHISHPLALAVFFWCEETHSSGQKRAQTLGLRLKGPPGPKAWEGLCILQKWHDWRNTRQPKSTWNWAWCRDPSNATPLKGAKKDRQGTITTLHFMWYCGTVPYRGPIICSQCSEKASQVVRNYQN
jgi:hypothetical protein